MVELTDHRTEHREKQQQTLLASESDAEHSLDGTGFGECRLVPLRIMKEGTSRNDLPQL